MRYALAFVMVIAAGCNPAPVATAPDMGCGGSLLACAGLCVDVLSDPDNCGTCGRLCPSESTCRGGYCMSNCPGAETLCGQSCVSLSTDATNCGTCAAVCAAGQVCGRGVCANICPVGMLLCNGQCTEVANDPAHCGNCTTACTRTQSCSAGVCGVLCADTQTLCAGACANTGSDDANCGGCGVVCAGGTSCVGGRCALGCGKGQMICGGACVDPEISDTNCGVCGVACDQGYHCVAGACALSCPGSEAACRGSCVNVQSDPHNCGRCDLVCAINEQCAASQCVPLCGMGTTDCSGACVNLQTDSQHCGACGTQCAADQVCVAGACSAECTPPMVMCNNKHNCVDIRDDPNNCGICNKVCPVEANSLPACINGQCAISCKQGWQDCDGDPRTGCEQNVLGDANNCGSCGVVCQPLPNAAPSCAAGACGLGMCSPNFADCDQNANDGCETMLNCDVNNCGACNNLCPFPANATRGCSAGVCGIGQCNGDFADCDGNPANGCETNLDFDVNNCGGCGFACPAAPNAAPFCDDGDCDTRCTPGWSDCNGDPSDGCESNPVNDPNNCGGCGMVCNGLPNTVVSCVKSTCMASGVCKPGYADCDMNKANGCEANLNEDANNCGACGAVCAKGLTCGGGMCVNLYAPVGIQMNVPVANLTGWSLCYHDTYDVAMVTPPILQACTGSKLLIACRPNNAANLTLMAWAPRADVTFNTGESNTPHLANNVEWYFNATWSWGFAGPGEMLSRNVCDTEGGADRMCWHTGINSGGYRCGNNTDLNDDPTWDRLVYQAN